LFFAAAKKSRCRPAQGRRVKRDNASRMPAQNRIADASAKPNPGCQRKTKSRMPAQNQIPDARKKLPNHRLSNAQSTRPIKS
ncbi:hypothetical protein, partial [Paraburkholderia caribensis]